MNTIQTSSVTINSPNKIEFKIGTPLFTGMLSNRFAAPLNEICDSFGEIVKPIVSQFRGWFCLYNYWNPWWQYAEPVNCDCLYLRICFSWKKMEELADLPRSILECTHPSLEPWTGVAQGVAGGSRGPVAKYFVQILYIASNIYYSHCMRKLRI